MRRWSSPCSIGLLNRYDGCEPRRGVMCSPACCYYWGAVAISTRLLEQRRPRREQRQRRCPAAWSPRRPLCVLRHGRRHRGARQRLSPSRTSTTRSPMHAQGSSRSSRVQLCRGSKHYWSRPWRFPPQAGANNCRVLVPPDGSASGPLHAFALPTFNVISIRRLSSQRRKAGRRSLLFQPTSSGSRYVVMTRRVLRIPSTGIG